VSSNLPVTTGGGAVVSLPAGSVIPAADGGDMSVDRGAGLRSSSQSLHGDIQRAAGVALGVAQIKRVQEVLLRNRQALDLQQRAAAEKAIKASWGVATEGNLIRIHEWLENTMGREAADEILGARDGAGNGICNKLPVLEGLLKAVNATPSNINSGNGGSAADQRRREVEAARAGAARLHELNGWMANRDPRYWKDEAVQREYRDLLDRGVTADGTPKTVDSGVVRRIKEIEVLMGARPGSSDFKRYWNDPKMQEEYRELQRRRQ
jgi:hypothetical protein